jgi:acyl dehydratase
LGLVASHFSKGFSVVGVLFTLEFHRPVFADAMVRIEWKVVATNVTCDGVQRVEKS